jgi:hypothetical protein
MENDKRIYNEELKDFLPGEILDVHTHVYLYEYVEKARPNEVNSDLVTAGG